MEPQIEKIIKFGLLIIIILAGLSYWLIPKLKLRSKFHMNEKVFVITQLIGIVCGIAGLFITFIYPQYIIEWHLWELLIIPYFIIHVYWLIVMKIVKSSAIFDEKQEYDMGKAGGVTVGITFPAMVLVFILYQNEIVSGLIWFPYFIFVSVLVFSFSSLIRFKRN